MTNVILARRRVQRHLAALALTGLLVCPSPVRGDESADEVRRLASDADRAIRDGRWADALKTTETLFLVTGDAMDACNAGRLAYRIGHLQEAYEHLSACDRLGTPGESKLNTYDKATLAAARTELALVRARVARLWVFVSKPGADVTVDDRKIGASPLGRELVLDPGEHRITARLGNETASASVDIPAGAMKQADLTLAAQTPPAEPTPPASPLPLADHVTGTEPSMNEAATKSPRTWPGVLAYAAGGISLVGVGVATGSYIAYQNAADEIRASFPTANAFGCYGAAAECNKVDDALESAKTAEAVMYWSIGASGILAASLLTAAVWGDATAPVKIRAAPTVGGISLWGEF